MCASPVQVAWETPRCVHQLVPSVQHYLILDPERRAVAHHKRAGGQAIEKRVLTDGVAVLDPPGFEVAVAAMFPPPDEA